MRLNVKQATALAFACAGILSVTGAYFGAGAVEKRTQMELRHSMSLEGLEWVQIAPDGMRAHLSGIAPSESARFRALTLAGQIIDSEHVIDEMGVAPSQEIIAPSFSIEILRKPNGLSAIGLIPASQNRVNLLLALERASDGGRLTDLIETADYPMPDNWQAAVAFGVDVAAELSRSKISISSDAVVVEAIADSARDQQQIEKRLRQRAPDNIELVTNITAPRPAITPFVLRAVLDEDGLRFDACAAETPLDRNRILIAAQSAENSSSLDCVIGLGAPSDAWADTAVIALETLLRLGRGSVTFTNADISLLGAADVDPALFQEETSKLAKALPAPYTLHADLQEALRTVEDGQDTQLIEFQVIKSPEGHLRVSGPLPDVLTQQAVESYLYSRFGMERLSNRIEIEDDLPTGWPVRVLTGIEALSELNNGVVTIQPEFMDLQGSTGDPEARARIAQLLGRKLGTGQTYAIDVEYLVTLDPQANLPTPQECVDGVNTVLAENKITFSPGSVTVEGSSVQVVNKIAEAMQDCQDVRMEIGGHTDSQGREEMNLQLSQSRAEAVLNALLARRVLTSNLTARGYGETVPIADNGTEEGREANRRIEFKLIEEPVAEDSPQPETVETPPADAAADSVADASEESAEEPAVVAPPEADASADAPADDAATLTDAADAESAAPAPTGPGSDAVLVPRPSPEAEQADTDTDAEAPDEQN